MLDEQRENRSIAKYGGHPSKRRYYKNGPVYVFPPYGYYPYGYVGGYVGTTTYLESPAAPSEVVTYEPEPPAYEPPPPPMGMLRLEVEPRDLIQIFVDGIYIGTPADVSDEIGLTPGIRTIELRARGYKTVTFSAEIVRDRSITYRAILERDPDAPAPAPVVLRPAPASGSSTMYLIPGCYLGNIAPTPATLRPGCDISKLTKFEP